jgi:hypothetical protein
LTPILNTIPHVRNAFSNFFSYTTCGATDGFTEATAEGSYNAALFFKVRRSVM